MNKIELSQNTKIFLKAGAPYWIGATILIPTVMLIIDVLSPPVVTKHIWIYGIPIVSILPSFLLFCVGIAWVFHGFGFIIVRG